MAAVEMGEPAEAEDGRRFRVGAVIEVGGATMAVLPWDPEGGAPEELDVNGSKLMFAFKDPTTGIAYYWADPDDSEVTPVAEPEEGRAFVYTHGRWHPVHVTGVGTKDVYLAMPEAAIPGPEDAGAPVYQKDGVIGVLTFLFTEDDIIGRAVRLDHVIERAERLMRMLKESRAWRRGSGRCLR